MPDLSCVSEILGVFFRPQLCLSDLSCLSEILVVVFRLFSCVGQT